MYLPALAYSLLVVLLKFFRPNSLQIIFWWGDQEFTAERAVDYNFWWNSSFFSIIDLSHLIHNQTTTIMVRIRLRREGAKGRPFYRIVVADQRARREGAFIEVIGTHDPLKTEDKTKIDLEKADEWIGKGAQPTETVRSLIKKARQAEATA